MAAETPTTPGVTFETPPPTRKRSFIEQDATLRRDRAQSSHRDVLAGLGVTDDGPSEELHASEPHLLTPRDRGGTTGGRERAKSGPSLGSGMRMASGHAGSRRHSNDAQSGRFKSSRRFNEQNVFRGESVASDDLSGFVAPVYAKSAEATALLKEALAGHFLFAQLRAPDLDELAAAMFEVVVQPGSFVIQQGDVGTAGRGGHQADQRPRDHFVAPHPTPTTTPKATISTLPSRASSPCSRTTRRSARSARRAQRSVSWRS